MSTLELVLDARARLGEGPAWDARDGTLWWVDILGRAVHAFRPADGSQRTLDPGGMPGCLVPAADGALIAAVDRSIVRLDTRSGARTVLAQVEPGLPGNRFNDGKCDPAGRLLAGTMDMAERQASGALYSFTREDGVRRLLSDVRISNGLAWNPDGGTLYYIDTPTRAVRAFDYDPSDGAIANPRAVITVPEELGWPDGMTADAQGNLWIAMWGGAQVTAWDPRAGRLLERYPLPAPQVTACVFAGDGLQDLYITTARQGLDEAQLAAHPHSGGLFRLRPGVSGQPAHVFGK